MFGRPDSLEGMKEEFIDLNKTFCTGFQPPQHGSEKLFIRLFQVRKKTWSQYHCYCSHDLIPWLPIFTFVSSQFLLFNGLGNLPDLLLLEYSPPLPMSPPRPLILKGLQVLSALWLILLSQFTSPPRPILFPLLLLLSVSLFAEVLQSLLPDFLFSFPCMSKLALCIRSRVQQDTNPFKSA